MKLAVGATSRLVVEEALEVSSVAQIIASRSQVNGSGGYTGITQTELVDMVKTRRPGMTIVRDHGGPGKGPVPLERDDWMAELEVDIAAGFDTLHLDVSELDADFQDDELIKLIEFVTDIKDDIGIEIGGERDSAGRLAGLYSAVAGNDLADRVGTIVVEAGGYAWADRQRGMFVPRNVLMDRVKPYKDAGVKVKAHNMDWAGNRHDYDAILDFYNIAPEFAAVEIDAWMRYLPRDVTGMIMTYALNSTKWMKWYRPGEGTSYEHARTAARYIWNEPEIQHMIHNNASHFDIMSAEIKVRQDVREAIAHA